MGTKNAPGAYDCYANAADDEPMFVLLGRDRHAPVLVRLWALLRARDNEDEEKLEEALACAANMEAYSRERGRPVAQDTGTIAALYIAATDRLDEHPDSFDNSCDCNTCRSYSDG